MKRPVLRALLTGAAMAIPLGAAQADDLRGALINAYQTNPDLQAARAHLDEVVGVRTSEDVLQHIFATFCIGK